MKDLPLSPIYFLIQSCFLKSVWARGYLFYTRLLSNRTLFTLLLKSFQLWLGHWEHLQLAPVSLHMSLALWVLGFFCFVIPLYFIFDNLLTFWHFCIFPALGLESDVSPRSAGGQLKTSKQ